MVPLTVAAQEQHLVCDIVTALAVHRAHLVLEALPLRLAAVGVDLRIRVVGPVDEAEIGRNLEAISTDQRSCRLHKRMRSDWRRESDMETYIVEGAGICGGIVLQEVPGDRAVIEVGREGHGLGHGGESSKEDGRQKQDRTAGHAVSCVISLSMTAEVEADAGEEVGGTRLQSALLHALLCQGEYLHDHHDPAGLSPRPPMTTSVIVVLAEQGQVVFVLTDAGSRAEREHRVQRQRGMLARDGGDGVTDQLWIPRD